MLNPTLAVNVNRASALFELDLRDVFAFEPFPNRLRPSDLPLGRLRSGQRQPITLRLQLAFLGRFRIRAISQSSASFGLASWTAQERSTSTAHLRSSSLICGTFSHSSRFPIVCVLRTCLLDGSEAVNVSQSRFACSSRSWDVFAFEPFPNRLRPSDLPLGRLRSGQRQPRICALRA